MAGECACLAEHVRRCDGEVEGELGGQVGIGDAAYAVGAEEAPHGCLSAGTAGALRAFFGPYFFRSLTRASRDRNPAFFKAGRFASTSASLSAGDAQAQGARLPEATAGDAGNHVVGAIKTNVRNGSLTSCWWTLFGK